jgi:hypothetical protein
MALRMPRKDVDQCLGAFGTLLIDGGDSLATEMRHRWRRRIAAM